MRNRLLIDNGNYIIGRGMFSTAKIEYYGHIYTAIELVELQVIETPYRLCTSL